MDLVQVDMVDPQGAQTLLHAAPDPCRAGVADQCVAVHAQPALGGDHHLVHLTGQSSAEQAFRGPEPISLGRVEHVDAQLAGVTDALYRRPILDLTPFPPTRLGCCGSAHDGRMGRVRVPVACTAGVGEKILCRSELRLPT